MARMKTNSTTTPDSPRLRPAERHAWLLTHLSESETPLGILDSSFVDEYLAVTGVPFTPMAYGAHRCPTLGRDLSAMHRKGLLARESIGVPAGYSGMPTWVYEYEVVS